MIGRFTRPDPYGGSADAAIPQSWNRYAYLGNDPANNIDTTGLDYLSESGGFYSGSFSYTGDPHCMLARRLSKPLRSSGFSDWCRCWRSVPK